jgi:hypothetical protein
MKSRCVPFRVARSVIRQENLDHLPALYTISAHLRGFFQNAAEIGGPHSLTVYSSTRLDLSTWTPLRVFFLKLASFVGWPTLEMEIGLGLPAMTDMLTEDVKMGQVPLSSTPPAENPGARPDPGEPLPEEPKIESHRVTLVSLTLKVRETVHRS